MTIFKAVRLSIWGIIFASGITVAGIYLALSQTILTTNGLQKIAADSQIASSIRKDIITPKVLQATQSYEYTALLDDTTVTDAINETFTDAVLAKKIEPAITSLHDWLDSKVPAITFSLSTSDLTASFSQTLAKKVIKNYQAAPTCTIQNTRAEALAGECRSPFITDESLTTEIQQSIETNASIREISTITPDMITIPAGEGPRASDLPTYLNIFYAISIVAAGIAAIVGLWLLLKHRLNGIITLGGSTLAASGFLFIALIVISRTAEAATGGQQMQEIIASAIEMIEASVHAKIIILAIVGAVLILIGIVTKIVITRYRKSNSSMHLSSEHDN